MLHFPTHHNYNKPQKHTTQVHHLFINSFILLNITTSPKKTYLYEMNLFAKCPRGFAAKDFAWFACILCALTRAQNARKPNIIPRDNDLLNRYLLCACIF